MSTDLLPSTDEALSLARRLCALTGEDAATAVTLALREHVRRAEGLLAARPENDRAAVLARAIRANAGPGIPVNHCWGEGDTPRADNLPK